MCDKKDELGQSMLFRSVAKIPISKTPNELAATDFADYGDQDTFMHLRDTFARYSAISFIWGLGKRRTERMIKQ